MINPDNISTVRVGQLPPSDFNLTDKVPHEVGTELNQGTIQQLADFIANYIGTTSGVAFRPVTVTDGQTLPNTTQEEWILVGKGTFYNVNGGATITTTEELNAIMSNGSYWFVGVEIPINVELAGIVQTIRETFTETTPSEDAVFKALALKADITDLTSPIQSIPFARLLTAQQDFIIPINTLALWADVNGTLYYPEDATNLAEDNTFTQTGNTVSYKSTLEIGNISRIFIQ